MSESIFIIVSIVFFVVVCIILSPLFFGPVSLNDYCHVQFGKESKGNFFQVEKGQCKFLEGNELVVVDVQQINGTWYKVKK
jgi:hypothetical protein